MGKESVSCNTRLLRVWLRSQASMNLAGEVTVLTKILMRMITRLMSQLEERLLPKETYVEYLTDVCIICYSEYRRLASNPPPHKFPSKRLDSLRRYLIDFYLVYADYGISYNWEAYRSLPKFAKITEFLAHANIYTSTISRLTASYPQGATAQPERQSFQRRVRGLRDSVRHEKTRLLSRF